MKHQTTNSSPARIPAIINRTVEVRPIPKVIFASSMMPIQNAVGRPIIRIALRMIDKTGLSADEAASTAGSLTAYVSCIIAFVLDAIN